MLLERSRCPRWAHFLLWLPSLLCLLSHHFRLWRQPSFLLCRLLLCKSIYHLLVRTSITSQTRYHLRLGPTSASSASARKWNASKMRTPRTCIWKGQSFTVYSSIPTDDFPVSLSALTKQCVITSSRSVFRLTSLLFKSLSALVSPHKILSSRFFQTKLSNPPRMIAFVR